MRVTPLNRLFHTVREEVVHAWAANGWHLPDFLQQEHLLGGIGNDEHLRKAQLNRCDHPIFFHLC